MNTAAPSESGGNTAKTAAKWMGVVVAAWCVLRIGVYLAGPATGGPISLGIVFPVGLLFIVGGQSVANPKALLALAVCGAVTVMAGVVLHMLGY